jgi:cobalamin biosynthesis Mg chelatase CobN
MTLTFTEPPSPETSLVTLGATRLPLSRPQGKTDTLIADLGGVPSTVRGPVAVAWRAVSAADGHVASGVIHLTVRTSGSSSPAPPKAAAAQAPQQEPHSSALWYLAALGVFAVVVAAGIGYAVRRSPREDGR